MLVVQASETYTMAGVNRSRSGSASVLVRVRNLKDNPPRFGRQLYENSLDENIDRILVKLFTLHASAESA